MFKDVIIHMLNELGNDYDILGDEIKTTCLNPNHNDSNPSFFINHKTGANHCFSCGYSISPKRLFGDSTEQDVEEMIRKAKYSNLLSHTKVESNATVFFLPPKAYDINRDWRGLTKDLLLRLGVYYCDTGRFKGRLVFPVYEDELLLGADTRIVNPELADFHDAKWLRSKGMEVQKIVYPYNYIQSLPTSKRHHVILCEGVADALTYIQCGAVAIPTFGLGVPDNERIEKLLSLGVDTVTIGYDNDERGQQAILKVYPYYKKWFEVKGHVLVNVVRKSGCKDANEALQAGILKRRGDVDI
jgi:DNA primase